MTLRRGLQRGLHGLFDHPAVFDAYQFLIDGGKGHHIRAFLREVPYSSVLDIGCGTGNWATTARGRYLGVDTSRRFVEAARARYAQDARKQFEVIDAASGELPGSFDLVQMVSVLHHLSDDDVRDLLGRVMPRGRYLFVLDLYPIRWHPLSRLLYAADRGDFIRRPAEQEGLIREAAELRLLKRGDFFAPTTLYRHTLFLFERT